MTNSLTSSYVPNLQIDDYILSDGYVIEDNRQVIEYPEAINPDENHNSSESNNYIVGDIYQDDIIRGTAGNDNLFGTAGNDVFAESAGNDTLNGGEGNDKLRAGTGDDLLIGGKGVDTMTGGDGADLFRFNVIENKVDIIKDFNFGAGDRIEIMGETIGDSDKITYNLFSGNVSYEGQAVVNIGQQLNLLESAVIVEPFNPPLAEVVAQT